MATETSDQLQHIHYTYNLRFKQISREEEIVRLKKCPKKSGNRVYKGENCCIFVKRFIGIRKPASEQKGEKLPVEEVPFSVVLPVEPKDLMKDHYNTYCHKEMIQQAFSQSVFSEHDMIKMIDNMTKSIAALRTSDSTPSDVEVAFLREKDQLINKKLEVDNYQIVIQIFTRCTL